MDTKTQVDEPSASWPLIIDRIASIILLVAQPFVAIAQYLLVALGAYWVDGGRLIPHWAAGIAIALIFLVPLVAALATVVMLLQRRIAFWVPLLAMGATSVLVLILSAYSQ